MTPKLELIGHKIKLRHWQESDLPSYAHWLQPGHQWQHYDGPYYPKPEAHNIPQIISDLKRSIPKNGSRTPQNRLVIANVETDSFIGLVSWYWQSRETQWLSVGIVIYDETQWGQGLGFEALGLWCDYLFHTMPTIVRLDLRTWSGNDNMIHLARKLGFQEEARFRMARIVNGQYFDGLGFGMLREEWQTLYPNGFSSQTIPG